MMQKIFRSCKIQKLKPFIVLKIKIKKIQLRFKEVYIFCIFIRENLVFNKSRKITMFSLMILLNAKFLLIFYNFF